MEAPRTIPRAHRQRQVCKPTHTHAHTYTHMHTHQSNPWPLTWKLGRDHDEVIRVAGRVLAAAAGAPGALQEASSVGRGSQRLPELLLHLSQGLGVRGGPLRLGPRAWVRQRAQRTLLPISLHGLPPARPGPGPTGTVTGHSHPAPTELPGRLPARPARGPALRSGHEASNFCLQRGQAPSSHHGPWRPSCVCRGAGARAGGRAPGLRATLFPRPHMCRPAHTDPHLAGRPLGHEGSGWGATRAFADLSYSNISQPEHVCPQLV